MHQSRRATKKISQRERANLFGSDPGANRGRRVWLAMGHRGLLGKGSSKQQSAMEYLMTYGWAILIIAVVLGVLYYLGIFNSANLSPRLQPGSCHVTRTTQGTQTFGVCAGLPEFVAELGGSSSSGILMADPVTINQASSGYTVSAWVYTTKGENGLYAQSIFKGFPNNYAIFGLSLNTPNGAGWIGICGWTNGFCGSGACDTPGNSLSTNSWYNVVGVWTPGNGAYIYVNGKLLGECANDGDVSIDAQPEIGSISDINGYNTVFQGYISNVQLYNSSLSSAEIHSLYMEGIGGAPVIPQSIVGWWPLNGDANDYSGNNNNGQANNVQYTNTWINSYSAP